MEEQEKEVNPGGLALFIGVLVTGVLLIVFGMMKNSQDPLPTIDTKEKKEDPIETPPPINAPKPRQMPKRGPNGKFLKKEA